MADMTATATIDDKAATLRRMDTNKENLLHSHSNIGSESTKSPPHWPHWPHWHPFTAEEKHGPPPPPPPSLVPPSSSASQQQQSKSQETHPSNSVVGYNNAMYPWSSPFVSPGTTNSTNSTNNTMHWNWSHYHYRYPPVYGVPSHHHPLLVTNSSVDTITKNTVPVGRTTLATKNGGSPPPTMYAHSTNGASSMYAIPGGSTATATAMEDAHRFGYVSPWATTGTGIMNSSTGTTGSSTPHPFPSPTVKPYSVILNSNNTTNIGRASGTSSATNNDTPMPHGPSQFPFVTGTPPFAFATPTGNGIGIGIHPPMPQSHRLSSHSQTTPAPTATPVVVDVAVVATANSTATTATASTTSNATTKPVRRPAANLVLSDHPCQAPSPFAQTHSLVVVNTTEDTLNTSSNKSRIVVLVKSATDASFGITVQLDMVSGLVERNTTNGDPPPHKASVFRPHPSATAPPTPHGSTDNSSSSSRMVSVAPSAATVHAPPAGETQPGSLSAHNPESTANASLASFSQEPTISKAAMESTTGTVKGAAAAASLVVPKKQRRERRRRVFFAVMTVSDPSVQNQRLQELAASKPEAQATQQSIFLLQEGDIILTIGGKPTAGLPFVDACRLFRETCSASAVDDNGMIQCPITIARRRAPPQPLAALPLSSLAMTAPPAKKTTAVPRNPIVLKGPLQPLEIKAFCMTILAATTNPDRILGEPLFSFNVFAREWPQPELSGRGGVFQLDLLWKDSLCSSVEFIAKQQAMRHWKEQWTLEPVAVKNSLPAQNDVNPVSTHAGIKNKEYYTDAQRAVLRFAKRKPNQCRCKSTDHIYVNDVRCPLYSNLRRYLENNDSLVGTVSKENVNVSAWNAPDLSTVVPKAQRAVGDLLDREWKTVDKACKDRFVRVRAEQKAKDIQTEFVFMMEDIQLKHCKQASLAPSLAAMVLSAVVELQSEFAGRDLTPWTKTASVAKVDATSPSPPTESGPTEASIDDDSDDDDDIPLSALGKRPFEEEAPKATSEEYQNSPVRLQFVARILQLISSKWGHLYREPNHADYVWRWEVYHGQVAECGSPWNTYENPRSPKNLSFENVRFVVTDEIIANLEPTSNETTESSSYLEALTILSHFLSPGRTGVWDELAAMIKTKILEVDEHGIPALTKDWWTRVDILFLSEMNERCGFFADPKGVYGIVDTVRTTLSRKWIQCDTGWALTADTDDIIYDFEEFDEWRAAFNEKKNARSDRVDGIGKFR